jgi:uncharacterized membrane protein
MLLLLLLLQVLLKLLIRLRQLSGCGTCCCTKPTTRCHQVLSSGQVKRQSCHQ